jgi:hypothetical protein
VRFEGEDFAPDAPTAAARIDPPQPEPPSEALLDRLREVVRTPDKSINAIDDLAAELGNTPLAVRAGLKALADKREIAVNRKTGVFMRKAPPPKTAANTKRPRTLIEWAAERGGIWDGDPSGGASGRGFKGGELKALGIKIGDRAVGRRIIRPPEAGHGGRGLDNVLRDAVDEGYFPELLGYLDEAHGKDSFDTQILLDAIAEELGGNPRYSSYDIEAGRVRPAGDGRFEPDEFAIDPEERFAAFDDPEERAALEALHEGEALAAAAEAERARFGDPEGEAATQHLASLLHDLRARAAAEGETVDPDVKALLEAIDGDGLDVDAIKGCL